jgi:hypothetical protein
MTSRCKNDDFTLVVKHRAYYNNIYIHSQMSHGTSSREQKMGYFQFNKVIKWLRLSTAVDLLLETDGRKNLLSNKLYYIH